MSTITLRAVARVMCSISASGLWVATFKVGLNGKVAERRFIVDTGCSLVLLSHDTLKLLGIPVSKDYLLNRPEIKSKVASGSDATFVDIGDSLGRVEYESTLLAQKVRMMAHPTKETHDLIGAVVLNNFVHLSFVNAGVNSRYIDFNARK